MASVQEAPYYETKAGVAAFGQMLSQRHLITEHIRYYTVKSLMGELSGKTVLELGCGDGQLCEQIIKWGASKVVGYDISQAMIDECRSKKIPNSEFSVRDCSKLGKLEEQFDVVTSVFVMHYLPDYDSLVSCVRSVYDSLKPGGRYCGIVTAFEENHRLTEVATIGDMKRHYKRESKEEFCKMVLTFGDVRNPDLTMEFYALHAATVQKAMREGGFTEFEWRPFLLSAEGKRYYKEKDIKEQLTLPHPFVATKKAT